MTNLTKEINFKIRFKFANGEEFEAEGPQDFVLSQRDQFLVLIQKQTQPALSTTASQITATSRTPAHTDTDEVQADKLRFWERLFKEEGELLVLRKKTRLKADEAALLLLGGARSLLNKTQYSALLLSRSLQASGFTVGRLDRLLADALAQNYIRCEGTKRGRTYSLTPAGFTRALVLAEKREGEWV